MCAWQRWARSSEKWSRNNIEKPRKIIARPAALPLVVGRKRSRPRPAIIKADMPYRVWGYDLIKHFRAGFFAGKEFSGAGSKDLLVVVGTLFIGKH